MQLVVITNRPERARETLAHVAGLMPFVDRALAITPPALVDAFPATIGRLAVRAVDEERLLGRHRDAFVATGDHQRRNLLLRAALAESGEVADVFLMADDDARPLFDVDERVFVEDGRHHRYAFHDLATWKPSATDFDRGQRQTAALLAVRGLPTDSYAAHQPQVVDKALWRAVLDAVPEVLAADGPAVDEWSLYFNVGALLAPERFHPKSPYRTLAWPALPTDWERETTPGEYLFENFYPELYADGGPFAGLPTAYRDGETPELSRLKVARRVALDRVYAGRPARLLRRGAWALRSVLLRWPGNADDPRRRSWPGRALPPKVLAGIDLAIARGDDPSWTFPLARRLSRS